LLPLEEISEIPEDEAEARAGDGGEHDEE